MTENDLNKIQSLLVSDQDMITKIDLLRKAIKNSFNKENPHILIEYSAVLQNEIKHTISHIQSYLDELSPFILKIKENYVKDITEETTFCAVYLLMRYAIQNWFSILFLAKQGDYGSIPLIRVSTEAVQISILFTMDYHNGKLDNIDKWFKGKIINHEKYRKEYTRFFNKDKQETTLLRDTMKHLHNVESLFIHPSYIGIMTNISPITEDFDTSRMIQYIRINAELSSVLESIRHMNTSLKLVYKILLKDLQGYEQLIKIKDKYNTHTVE